MRLLLAALIGVMTLAPSLPEAHACSIAKRYRVCRFESLDHHRGFSSWEVRSTVACAVDHWSVPGGFGTALYIAERESGLYCKARNPYSSATGIFQIVDGTWASWWR